MSTLWDICLLVAGLTSLIIGADLLVRGAAELATRAGISSFVVGLTVVAFGTSMPELAAGVRAAVQDRGELVIGAVVGSNTANVALILGTTALIWPVRVRSAVVRREAPMMLAVSFFGAGALMGGQISRLEGAILSAGLLAFIAITALSARKKDVSQAEWVVEQPPGLGRLLRFGPKLAIALALLLGLGALVGGAELVVDSSERIARSLGVSETVIGISMVAVGTSLPELATCVMAALRKHSEIVVGNVLGSNIFNILCVLGVSSLAQPLRVPPETMWRDAPWMLGFAVACLPIMAARLCIGRLEGAVLLIAYAAYLWLVWSG
ncbi:MAG: calcium/sodium antiporter [Phycisphaerales bacterium JB039]